MQSKQPEQFLRPVIASALTPPEYSQATLLDPNYFSLQQSSFAPAHSGHSDNYFAEPRTLVVSVVSMEPNKEPYEMELSIRGKETSLKQIFAEDYYYWTKVFKGHSPKEPPGYGVFRKPFPQESRLGDFTLHILLLKCEGVKFPRNPNAHPFEQFCGNPFYGPMVVALNANKEPYSLSSFPKEHIAEIVAVNVRENRRVPTMHEVSKGPNQKKPHKGLAVLHRGTELTRAETLNLDEIKRKETAEEFFMYYYKTTFCPNTSERHDWAACIYAHRAQDFRRPPSKYYPENCPYSVNNKAESCPKGQNCNYAHSRFEQFYHPMKYRVQPCDQIHKSKSSKCARGELCAFYHNQKERRKPNGHMPRYQNHHAYKNRDKTTPEPKHYYSKSAREHQPEFIEHSRSEETPALKPPEESKEGEFYMIINEGEAAGRERSASSKIGSEMGSGPAHAKKRESSLTRRSSDNSEPEQKPPADQV